ncbi:hypothetical protein CSKR_103373, partial [Clonorchis sinensis]
MAVPGFEPRTSDMRGERVTTTPPTHFSQRKLLIKLLKTLRQPTTGFAVLRPHQVDEVPEFPSTLCKLFCVTHIFGNAKIRISDNQLPKKVHQMQDIHQIQPSILTKSDQRKPHHNFLVGSTPKVILKRHHVAFSVQKNSNGLSDMMIKTTATTKKVIIIRLFSRNTLICKSIWFCERLTRNPAESLVSDVSRQLNVLHQAASCFSCYDIRDIAIHISQHIFIGKTTHKVAESPSTAYHRFHLSWDSSVIPLLRGYETSRTESRLVYREVVREPTRHHIHNVKKSSSCSIFSVPS